jgi:hypothetical protein
MELLSTQFLLQFKVATWRLCKKVPFDFLAIKRTNENRRVKRGIEIGILYIKHEVLFVSQRLHTVDGAKR